MAFDQMQRLRAMPNGFPSNQYRRPNPGAAYSPVLSDSNSSVGGRPAFLRDSDRSPRNTCHPWSEAREHGRGDESFARDFMACPFEAMKVQVPVLRLEVFISPMIQTKLL